MVSYPLRLEMLSGTWHSASSRNYGGKRFNRLQDYNIEDIRKLRVLLTMQLLGMTYNVIKIFSM